MSPPLGIIHLVEAATINAVARIVLDFFRTTRELADLDELKLVKGSIVTFDRLNRSDRENQLVTAARSASVEIDVIPERRRFDLGVIPALESIIESRAPDLVVTNSVKSHFIVWRSRLWRKYPWVAFHHGYTTTDRKMRVYNRLDRWSLPKADRVATVCRAFAHELEGITGIPEKEIFVQHNAIQPRPSSSADEVRALRQSLGISADERVILSVGRLSKEKAHADLLAAFAELLKTNPEINCKLVVAGDGPERDRLESAARTSIAARKVIFAGQVGNIQPFYGIANVFALPSHSEGSPNVLLEAMAARVPVVATAVGGVPEMVQNDESALLVAPQNSADLAAAMSRLLGDAHLARRLTENAAALVKNVHSPEHYASSLIDFYRNTIEKRKEFHNGPSAK